MSIEQSVDHLGEAGQFGDDRADHAQDEEATGLKGTILRRIEETCRLKG